ncbi:hypothetical protein QBC44DRAFT_370267 [Cladorrhinum sp. PSN332]|nr:hypothetical protein QBC44DRAFT_370267 [Cladorrhinum sp. PSN332]
MQITRALQLLVLGLSAASVAEATIVNPRLVRHGRAIQRRQETDDGDSNAAVTSPPPATTPTAPPTTPTAPPNTPPAEESSSSSSRSTPPPVSSSTSSSSRGGEPQPTPSPSPSPSRTSGNQPPQTTAPPSESKTQEPVTATITQVITQTNADGSKSTFTSEILTTSTPGLVNDGNNNNNNNNSGKGLSTQSRNTIIGVVVGVGGAIVLGGLAFVAFRIWGRKKQQEENDGLMDYTSTGTAEKTDVSGSQSGRTPFQSTLESYHAPGQVNTASNF